MDLKQALKIAHDIKQIVDLPGNGPEQEAHEALLIIRDEMVDMFKKMRKLNILLNRYNKANEITNRQTGKMNEIFTDWMLGKRE